MQIATVEANVQINSPARSPTRYLSCRFLEGGITFLPGQVTACCANPANGRSPVIAPFKGGELTPDILMEGRRKIVDRHKLGDIVEECQGCPRLTEEDWRPPYISKYPIDEVTIAYFSSCNIRCNYCYTVTVPEMTAPLSKAPRLLATFQQLIERDMLAPDATVRFSGGEPSLSPEFEPLLSLLINHGVRSVIYTNAVKPSPAIIEGIKKDRIELVLGIDAATIDVYKKIKKMNYNEKVWETTALYCAHRQPNAINKIYAKFIFCIENYHEAEHFVRRTVAAGAKHVFYDFDASRARAGSERHGISLPEEVADQVAILRYECMRNGIETEFAQAGMSWLTPEREARIESSLQKLIQERGLPTAT